MTDGSRENMKSVAVLVHADAGGGGDQGVGGEAQGGERWQWRSTPLDARLLHLQEQTSW